MLAMQFWFLPYSRFLCIYLPIWILWNVRSLLKYVCLCSCVPSIHDKKEYLSCFLFLKRFLACSWNCASCSSSNLCLLCNSGFYLSQSACLSSCPSGFYAVSGVCTGLHVNYNSSSYRVMNTKTPQIKISLITIYPYLQAVIQANTERSKDHFL